MRDPAVRTEIKKALDASGLSMRQLARQIGLSGPAALSRFLSGRSGLSLEKISKIVLVLGIEGRTKSLLSEKLVPQPLQTPTEPRPQGSETGRVQTKELAFFVHPRAPLVYEIMKILGVATISEIKASLSPALKVSNDDISESLTSLYSQGLVRCQGVRWIVLDRNRDIVIPSRHSTRTGKRVVEQTLRDHHRFVDRMGQGEIFMRSTLTSLYRAPGKDGFTGVQEAILRLRDDLLALQQPGDNRVVSVLVSAVDLAGATRKDGCVPNPDPFAQVNQRL